MSTVQTQPVRKKGPRPRKNRIIPANGRIPRGAPTKFTPATRERILHLVRNAVPIQTAATIAGVSFSALHHWRALGEEHLAEQEKAIDAGETPEPSDFADFVISLEHAKAECEAALIEMVREAGLHREVKKVRRVQRPGADGKMYEHTEIEIQETRGDWRAPMEILSRRFNHHFKREPEAVNNTNIQVINFTDEDHAIAARIAARRLAPISIEHRIEDQPPSNGHAQ